MRLSQETNPNTKAYASKYKQIKSYIETGAETGSDTAFFEQEFAELSPQEKANTVNFVPKEGFSLLSIAINKGKKEIAKILLGLGANPDLKSGKKDNTSLHFACNQGDAETVSLLLRHGATPSLKTSGGNTALHAAAKKGYADIIAILLEHSPDLIDAINNEHETALLQILENYTITRDGVAYSLKTVELGLNKIPFLSHETYKRLKDNTDYVASLDLLLSAGADVNATDSKGNSALQNAFKAIIDFLRNGKTPPEEAASLLQKLKEHGADVNRHNEVKKRYVSDLIWTEIKKNIQKHHGPNQKLVLNALTFLFLDLAPNLKKLGDQKINEFLSTICDVVLTDDIDNFKKFLACGVTPDFVFRSIHEGYGDLTMLHYAAQQHRSKLIDLCQGFTINHDAVGGGTALEHAIAGMRHNIPINHTTTERGIDTIDSLIKLGFDPESLKRDDYSYWQEAKNQVKKSQIKESTPTDRSQAASSSHNQTNDSNLESITQRITETSPTGCLER